MTPATLVIYGRYWYDFFTLAWVVAFFLIEMLLLFRSTAIGWAMTAKCIALALVFSYAIINPPYPLVAEDVTVGSALVRAVLIIVLGYVIVVLIWMRVRQETVVVGRSGPGMHEPVSSSPPSTTDAGTSSP